MPSIRHIDALLGSAWRWDDDDDDDLDPRGAERPAETGRDDALLASAR